MDRARRRRIQDILVGFAVICLFVGGGIWLKVSANRKIAADEARCLAAFAAGLRNAGGGPGLASLDQAGSCYGELLRAKPFFSEMGFRAQAAADVAAFRREGANRPRPPEALANEQFRAGFEAFARGDLEQARRHFNELEKLPGSVGKLADHYRALVRDLIAVAR